LHLALAWLALAAGPDGTDSGGLVVEPTSARLVGSDASAQVLATARLDGRETDRTRAARYEVLDPAVASVDALGRILPRGDGTTQVIVRDGPREARVAVEVADFADTRPVAFATQVVPIFSKHGCNSGGCHGKSTGQNGFRMSLLGFDPAFDYEAIVRESRGRRVFPAAPGHSLILAKPSGAVPHGGGRKFGPASPEYRTIARWIGSGMPFEVEGEPELASLDVSPGRRVVEQRGSQQLRVTAHYTDGSSVDVTGLAQYGTNAADLATVDERGLVAATDGVGTAAIMVRFGGGVTVARVTVPRSGESVAWEDPPSANLVDRLVSERLRELNLPPSGPCTDAEFIRRATLDICGVLPDPDEAAAFEADADPAKRARLVDRLLARPEYADYFAMTWSAILRNSQGNFGNNSMPTTYRFHAWVREALAENRPYDEFAAALIAAKGDPTRDPAVAWYRPREFNQTSPESLAEDTAQLFLGMRIQCAKCHHHPFERWSQDDYYAFTSFFSRVGRKPSDDPFSPSIYTLPEGKATHPRTGLSYEPRALAGPEFANLGPRDDPRDRLVDWLRAEDNPFFARALVNRYWKHFFGRGLVEPEDDLRISNPPTDPELLDALASVFVRSGYDLKALVRLIATSQTYGRSSLPNAFNSRDTQSYARFYPRRLPAEVLLDAIDRVTGATEQFGGLPQGFRAVQLPTEQDGSYFLEVFGRPKRESVCECERTDEANLAQRLHLLNSPEVESKVAGNRAAKYAEDQRPDAAKVEELYRLAFARLPTDEERAVCLQHLDRARGREQLAQGYSDLIWTLINAKEFLFNR
jgi:hypothetical protein